MTISAKGYFISRYELKSKNDPMFLWDCYRRFRNLLPVDDDLVLANRTDYLEIFEMAKKFETIENPNTIGFTLAEVKALYRLLGHQFVSYEDMECIKVVRKIRDILDEEEKNDRSREVDGTK